MASAIKKAIEDDPSLGMTGMLDGERKRAKAWKRKHVNQIRGTAKRVGVNDPTLSDRYVSFAEIVRDASVASGLHAILGETVWRELSGLSHPSMMRSVRSMDREEIVNHGDGTLGAMFTTNAQKVKYSIEAAFIAFRDAVEIFGRRKITPGDPRAYRPAA